MKPIAIYPGSFDPISNGHLDIIQRTSVLFDKVYVVVGVNPKKQYIFTADERVMMLKKATSHLKNVIIEQSDELLVDYASKKDDAVLVRGVRNINDYENEITMYQFNHALNPRIETIVMFPSANNLFVSASYIKELALFKADISPYVPEGLAEFIGDVIRKRR